MKLFNAALVLTLSLSLSLTFSGSLEAQTKKDLVEGALKPRQGAKERTSLTVRNQAVNGGLSQKLFVSAPTTKEAELIKKSLKRPDARSLKALIPTAFDGFFGGGGPLAAFQGCTGNAQVTVLANEITYGAGGPQVPTRLKYQIGTNEPVLILDPVHSMIGTPINVPMVPGEEVSFWGHSAYPDFENPYLVNFEKRSDDEFMATILSNGNVLADMMASKGAASVPFGVQQSLQNILGSRMQGGVMNLANDELVILFELGATSSGSPAFDFNDLVLLVKTNCPVTTEVVLRDSIGADISWTNENNNFDVTSTGGGHRYVGVPLTPSQNVRLSAVAMVIGSYFDVAPPINWSAFTYRINVWSSPAARSAAPRQGDVVYCSYTQPANAASSSSPPPTFGQSRSAFGVLSPSFLAEFDLISGPGGSCSLNNSLLAGNTYIFTIDPGRNGNGSDGGTAAVESIEDGDTDIMYGGTLPGGQMNVIDMTASQHEGRVAYKIVAAEQ